MYHSALWHSHLFWIPCAVSIAGCASNPTLNAGMSSVASVEGGVGRGDALTGIAEFKVAQRVNVPIPINDAWVRLSKTYSDLGIPLTTLRPQDHILGNEGMRRSHTFADQRLSSLLDCGTGSGGDNADLYSVNMSVVTRLGVQPDSTTEVATLVQATATPMTFGTAAIVCSTRGWLEAKIASMVSNPK